MNEPQPTREEALFDLAVEKSSAAERAAFLDRALAGISPGARRPRSSGPDLRVTLEPDRKN